MKDLNGCDFLYIETEFIQNILQILKENNYKICRIHEESWAIFIDIDCHNYIELKDIKNISNICHTDNISISSYDDVFGAEMNMTIEISNKI